MYDQEGDTNRLTPAEIDVLFDIAREALYQFILHHREWLPDLDVLPPRLRQRQATFITLYTLGDLHGCIGTVDPRQALAHDVAQNSVSAASKDPRFSPLTAVELPDTAIEISILSPRQQVAYKNVDDLAQQVRPGVDGVLVEKGISRGLLLPQVWEKLPDRRQFLTHVALKARSSNAIYHDEGTKVFTFQVAHFEQPAPSTFADSSLETERLQTR